MSKNLPVIGNPRISRIYRITYTNLRDHADSPVYGKGSLGPEAHQGPQRLQLSEILALNSLLFIQGPVSSIVGFSYRRYRLILISRGKGTLLASLWEVGM